MQTSIDGFNSAGGYAPFVISKTSHPLSHTHVHWQEKSHFPKKLPHPQCCFNFNGVRNTIISSSNEIYSLTVRRNERRQRDDVRGREAGMRAGVREIRDVSGSHKMMNQKGSDEEQSSNGLSFQIAP